MLFILDTDHVSLILRGDSKIQAVIENIGTDRTKGYVSD
jgi:hypothetical protein